MDLKRILSLAAGSDDEEEEDREKRIPRVETITNTMDVDETAPSSESSEGHGEVYPIAPRLLLLLEKVHNFGIECGSEDPEGCGGGALRELIVNSFHSLDAMFFTGRRDNLYVRVGFGVEGEIPVQDKLLRRISITDSGIGMTRGDLINNLSSLGRFEDPALMKAMERLANAHSAGLKIDAKSSGSTMDSVASSLGFFSSFLIAQRVVVVTKHDDDEPYLWELGITDKKFDRSFRILKGEAALERGAQVIAEIPCLSDSTKAARLAADPCTRFVGTAGGGGGGDGANGGGGGGGGGGNHFGPAGFPRGTTIHLILHPDATIGSQGGGGGTTSSSAAGMGKAAAAVLTGSASNHIVDESEIRAVTGGWGDGGLAVSSNYPLLFWTDQENSSAKDAQQNVIGATMGVEGEVVQQDNVVNSDDDELDEIFSKLPSVDNDDASDSTGRGVSSRSSTSSTSSSQRGAAAQESNPYATALPANSMTERAKYIPLRLSYEDRKVLRLAEGSLTVSGYTNTVDAVNLSEPKKTAKRRQKQVEEICALLNGIVIACNYEKGKELLEDREFSDYKSFFQRLFEIVRRYKIMNPEKMRSSYGKLLYLLQDAMSDEIRELLEFNVVTPIKTVYSLLLKTNRLEMLDDKHIEYASMEILPDKSLPRHEIQAMIKRKERSIEYLVRKYASSKLPPDDVRLCCYSICDNNSYLNSDRKPCDDMLALLDEYFSPAKVKEGYSLNIVAGASGARLTHSHERQWHFARQSLLLWREIINDMFRLWSLSEQDLLSPDAPYSLKNTGQGLQRVQPCPRTYRAMQQILGSVQKMVGNWVGSTMIHMGDHNVPNALNFIDKYNQVARILAPIVKTLDNLEQLIEDDEGIKALIDGGYGGLDQLRLDILHDFFRSAFDGS